MAAQKKQYIKLIFATLLVTGSIVFVYGRYKATMEPPPPVERPNEKSSSEESSQVNAGEIQKIFPSEERKQMREEIYGKLELSSEQREKMEKIARKYEGQFTPGAMEARMKEWKEVLTPEQWAKGQEMRGEIMQKIGSRIRSRVMERASVLPESERRKFEEKLDQRLQEREQLAEKRLNELNNPQTPGSEAK
jgi:hypothetical protein